MKAVTYQGKKKVEVKEVGDAKLVKRDDILVRVTSTAICGSDLHIYHGLIPGMYDDYVIGHEPMGIVEETGPDVTRVKKATGSSYRSMLRAESAFSAKTRWKANATTPMTPRIRAVISATRRRTAVTWEGRRSCSGCPSAISCLSRYRRMPRWRTRKFCSSPIFFRPPIGGRQCRREERRYGHYSRLRPGRPAGAKFAWQKGAKRVIAVDHVDYRLEHAKRTNNVETYNFEKTHDIDQTLLEATKGGADVVIDCVGLDAKRTAMEKVETALMLQGGSLGAFNTAANVVRKFGTIQVIGVYGLKYNMFPFGHLFERNVQVKMGQAPVIHYMPELFRQIQTGKIDPTDIITHRLHISDAPRAYEIFDNKDESCIKVVLKP